MIQTLQPLAPQPLAAEIHRLIQQTVGATLRRAAEPGAAEEPPLRVPAGVPPQAPAQLAAAHPGGPAARSQAQALYARCLQHYRRVVQPKLSPGISDDDVGAAAAYFVLANLAALSGTEPDPATLPVVERQLRHLLLATEAWRSADLAQRRHLFEQFALLGVLVNESRLLAGKQGPAARANLQQAARGYLQQLLGLDASLLTVSLHGLAAADTVH